MEIVEQISGYKKTNSESPKFCLYEDVDPESLELLFESTDGPLITEFQIDDVCVTVEKTTGGKIDVEVEPAAQQQASN